jgi:ABC-type transport system involved in multi-copper enzyme maturation permease subunit
MKLLGPVFFLELRTAARRPRLLGLRALYATLLLLALGNIVAAERAPSGWTIPVTRVARLGEQFFWTLSFVQLLAVLLVTPALTAGTIAEEKEQRTLENLLTTDLANAEIALAKLTARLLLMVGLLLAGLPALTLCVGLGGVSAENLLAVLAITAIMLLETGALTLWVSMYADRGHEAMQVVYVAGVVLGLLPPLFALSPIPWPGGVVGAVLRIVDQGLTGPNPVVWLVQSWQTGTPNWQAWVLVLTVNAALACVLILLAVRHIRHAALRPVSVSPARRTFGWLRLVRPRMGQRGVLWKELFTERSARGLGSATRTLPTIIGWGSLLWMLWAWAGSLGPSPAGTRTPFQVFALLVEPPLLCIGLLGVVVRAATCISGERERGQWDSLLITPVSAGEVIWGKLAGCLWSMRWLWLLIALLWVLGLVCGQLRLVALVETLFVVIAVALCAATLGLLLSLCCKTSLRALIAAVGVSLLLSGGYLLFALPLFMPLGPGSEPPFGLLAPCVPFLLVTSMVLGVQDVPNAPQLLATCTTGGTLYMTAWLILLAIVWRSFDNLAGRTSAFRSPGRQIRWLPAGKTCTSSLARTEEK